MALIKPRFVVLVSMVLAAAATRLIPHPPNLTSIAAVALFGGAYFEDRRLAFAVPLGALLLGDLVIGFHSAMPAVYLSFALVVGLGMWLSHRRNPLSIAGAAIASSLLFFVVVDLGVWAFGNMYPKTWEGLVACYVAAIPFLRNSLAGDLAYSLILFGGFWLLEQRFAALREPAGPAGALAAA